MTITIEGTNDAPVITDGPDVVGLTETDAKLTSSGTLTVSDVDVTDVVTATRTLAVSEATDGYLDMVNLSWDRSSPKIEICDLAIVRLS